nr:ATP-binding protein [uncultured Acetatifactor sp.]
MGENWIGVFPVEDALEMILIFNRTGEIIYANAAARNKLGYEPGLESGEESLEGKHISDVFPAGAGNSEAVLDTQAKHLVMYRKNRTCFPAETKFLQGEEDGCRICMANDILEKEHLAREIEQVREEAGQAAKVKSEFVANVTHELRTPVNGILGNVRELLGGPLEERTAKALQLIERCCGDMNKIIDNILDFSKLEAGKFTLEPRKFHFRNMLDYIKAQHISRITEKGLDFFLTVSPQVPEYVEGDELRIVQILNNLLSNALKFTAVGKITLQALLTARVDKKVEIFFLVSDTGIGIAREDRDKLFKSFSQVDASISRKYGGTGLGLNICKQLVELMGGSIEVESEIGRGSSFSFSVWVGECGEDAGPAPDDIKAAFRNLPRMAEDEGDVKRYGTASNREALEKNLSKLILSVEMENWEKAEMFMETVRQLTENAPPDIKRRTLRLKMAIQKEDYEKVTAEFDTLYHNSLTGDEARESGP